MTDGKNIIEDTSGFPYVMVTIDFHDKRVKDISLKLNSENGWESKVKNVKLNIKVSK